MYSTVIQYYEGDDLRYHTIQSLDRQILVVVAEGLNETLIDIHTAA